MTETTRTLWRSWRTDRDARAFEDLVRDEMRYAADLARRLGASAAEAEDVVQESLLKMAQERTDAPVEVGVRAYLCRRVVLGWKMHVRSSVRRRRHEGRVVSVRRPPPRPGRRIELRDEVETALRELSDEDRQVVVMRHLHDLDYEEIAYVLGVSVNACRIRVHRALGRLRRRLGPRAAALVAVLGVPALTTESAIAGGAVAAAGTKTILGLLGGKIAAKIAVLTVAAAAATTAIVAVPDDPDEVPDPAPVETAAAPAPEPPAPPPPPPPAPAPEPALPAADPARALVFVEDHFAGRRDASRLLRSFDRIAELARGPVSPAIRVEATDDPTDLDLGDLARKARRIELGPGTFRVVRGVSHSHGLALEIQGAGTGRTTLVCPSADIWLSQERATLVVRDLTYVGDTVEPPGHAGGFLTVRETMVAVFERVRFQGWHVGAGFSAPVGTSPGGRALLAFRDCVFVGGWRRRAGGTALAIRGDNLVLMERCRFADVAQVLRLNHTHNPPPSARSLVHLDDCVFDNARLLYEDVPRREGTYTRFPVHVRRPRILFGDEQEPREARLARWTTGREVDIEEPTLEPEIARCTLGRLRSVLEGFRGPENERVVAVEVLTWLGCRDPRYVVWSEDARGTRRKTLVRLVGEKVELDGSGTFWLPRWMSARPGERPGLLDLLRRHWSRLDLRAPVGGVTLHRNTASESVLRIHDRMLDRLPLSGRRR